jgi:putative ABC transport system permease protein
MMNISFRPRWRKLLSDLWDNKARTLLVVISIAIGVFAVGMITGAYSIIASDLNTGYADANPANIEIFTDPFNKDFLSTIERLDGVKDVEGRRTIDVRLKTVQNQWDMLSLVAIPKDSESKINQLLPVKGALNPANREIVLERKTMEFYGYQIGQQVEIELSDGTIRSIPVVGSVLDRTIGYGAFTGERKGYITTDTIDWLGQPIYYNQLLVTVSDHSDDKAYIEQVSNRIKDHLEKGGRQVYRVQFAETHKHPLDSIVKALLGVLLTLGILVVFLSGSLIANTLTALLSQHLGQIGVMKLIGARSRQINTLYLMLIFSFSLIALVIAIPFGNWAALAISQLIANLLNVVLKNHSVIPLAIISQVIIAVGVPLLAGIFPVRRGSRITVQKAFAGTGVETGSARHNYLDRVLEKIRGISRPSIISLRNTFRRKERLALTLFNLTLGGAIFISVFNVQVSLNNKIEETTRYFLADLNVNFEQSYRIQEVRSIAMTIPGVVAVEGWAGANGEILRADDSVAENVSILGPPANTNLISPIMLKGRWLLPDDENALAVNEAFWKTFPELKPGDTLRIKIDGHSKDWTVVGIFQYTGMSRNFAYANYEYLSRILKGAGEASTYRMVTTDHSAAFQESIRNQVDQLFRDHGFKVSSVQAGSTLVSNIINYINILVIFLLIMALLIAVVGSISLAGTLSMNVMERTREIGVMRAIGAHDRIIFRLVIVEGLVISGISFLFGSILSLPITSLLSNIISKAMFNSPAKFALSFQGFAIWIVVAVLFSVLASLIPARNASKMTIREVLTYE